MRLAALWRSIDTLPVEFICLRCATGGRQQGAETEVTRRPFGIVDVLVGESGSALLVDHDGLAVSFLGHFKPLAAHQETTNLAVGVGEKMPVVAVAREFGRKFLKQGEGFA